MSLTTATDTYTPQRVTLTLNPEPWQRQAACREVDPEFFFEPSLFHQGKKICAGCPVAAACEAAAVENEERFGLWAGLTERQIARRVREKHMGAA